ncbi:MAG: TIGR03915 family putative DNA repair protein [Treponema sp.]|jgi:probable DNA metabolism protein|nr:TIGR03915 family putative DNA repair protein [Treponema sp.]
MIQEELFRAEETEDRRAGDLERILERLGDISPDARDDAVNALLSEQLPEAVVRRFAAKVLNAAETAGAETENGRRAAEKARTDRLDSDTGKIQAAAYKTLREFDRLRGLLRFKPEAEGRYTARCAPDHFVLPLLADHFSARFADVPWAVIDEKRRLVLRGGKGGTEIAAVDSESTGGTPAPALDSWEALWRTFHRAVNNEDRNNPALQRQFIPGRYRKYLTEFF